MSRTSLGLAACVFALAALISTVPPSTAEEPARVDINQAGIEELTTLPGVGEAIARRIVEFREKNGPFRRVEDLLKVKGIGEKSLEKLRPYVRVGKSR